MIEDGGIAIKGGRIVAVGTRAEIDRNYAARADESTRTAKSSFPASSTATRTFR